MKKKPSASIEHFDMFSSNYDAASKQGRWWAPEALFGMTYSFKSSGQKILDIGIGTGQSSILDHRAGLEVYGVDGSSKMLQECEKKGFAARLEQVDLGMMAKLPFHGMQFHHVSACGVFYFFSDLEKFFKEARRLLLPGGIFAFNVEDPQIGYDLAYINYDNDPLVPRLVERTGVKVFRHPEHYIIALAKKYGFAADDRIFSYLAYHSPTEKKDIFFKQYVLKLE